MRIAIYGAGGVGGYYGGALRRRGHDIALLARGEHLAAIRKSGLRVLSPKGDFRVRPTSATDDPTEIGPVDVAIAAVEFDRLDDVKAGLPSLSGPETLVLPLLNGVGWPRD